MNDGHANEETQPDADADTDRQADAMRTQLRKDVAAWSAARSGGGSREAADAAVPPPKQAPAPVKRAKPAPPAAAAVPADMPKKPFRMSYAGVTESDYISYMIKRGH